MTRTNRVFASLLVALVVVAAPAGAEQVAENGEFSVNLPSQCGELQRQAQTLESDNGPIETVTWVGRGDGGICIVNYTELTGPIIEPEAQIDNGVESLMKELGTTIEREKDQEIAGFPGRSIAYSGTAGSRQLFGRTDFAVAHDRIYQVIYIGYTPDDLLAAENSGYFRSLAIEAPDLEEAQAQLDEPAELDETPAADSNESTNAEQATSSPS